MKAVYESALKIIKALYKSALKIYKCLGKIYCNMIMTFCKLSRLGYPSMYFCSLATIVCCTRQWAFLLNQSQNENEIRIFDRLTGIP